MDFKNKNTLIASIPAKKTEWTKEKIEALSKEILEETLGHTCDLTPPGVIFDALKELASLRLGLYDFLCIKFMHIFYASPMTSLHGNFFPASIRPGI